MLSYSLGMFVCFLNDNAHIFIKELRMLLGVLILFMSRIPMIRIHKSTSLG